MMLKRKKITWLYNRYVKRRVSTHNVNWGIIGTGSMGNWFAYALACVEGANVYAVSSRSKTKAKKFARKHKCKHFFDDYNFMLDDLRDELDVIYIATPNECHYEQIKSCLVKGYNVICEKPITSNVRDFDELVEIARHKNSFLMEGMWSRCLPTYQKAIDLVGKGKIGDIISIQVDLSKELVSPIGADRAEESVLMDYGVYAIAFPNDFVDNYQNFRLISKKRIDNCSGSDIDWQLLFRMDEIDIHISLSRRYSGSRKAVVTGTMGEIIFEPQFNRTNKIIVKNMSGEDQTFCYDYVYDGFEYEIQEVHKSLKQGLIESEKVSWESTQTYLKIVEMILNTEEV